MHADDLRLDEALLSAAKEHGRTVGDHPHGFGRGCLARAARAAS